MVRTKVDRFIDVEITTIAIFLLGKRSKLIFHHIKTHQVLMDVYSTPTNHGANAQRQGGNNPSFAARKRRNSDNDEDSKQRKCGLCKETGHTRRNCPSLNF
jgi:hypothetical protein